MRFHAIPAKPICSGEADTRPPDSLPRRFLGQLMAEAQFLAGLCMKNMIARKAF